MDPTGNFDPRTQPVSGFNQRHSPQGYNPRPLTAEEIQEWNNCIKSGFYKLGVPFAFIMHYLNHMRNKGPNAITTSPLKMAIAFGFNCFLGSIFYSPVCYSKLQKLYFSNEEKLRQKQMESNFLSKGVDNNSDTQDSNFTSSVDSKFDEPQSDFSHLNFELSSPFPENYALEDTNANENENEKVKTPETTYDELRKRNRNNFYRPLFTSSDNANTSSPRKWINERPSESEKLQSKETPVSRPKNKYGDEME